MNENIKKFIAEKPWVVPTAVGVLSAVAGGGAGYILGFRRGRARQVSDAEAVETRFDDEPSVEIMGDEVDFTPPRVSIEAEELEALRARWQDTDIAAEEVVISERILSEEEVSTITKFVDSNDAVEEIISPIVPEDDEPSVIYSNVFAGDDLDWDSSAEVAAREDSTIYIIHRDEYDAEEEGYEQIVLTYFAGDDLMAEGEAEGEMTLIPNYRRVVGNAVNRFGHGSKDPNVVYVRNEEREVEYQILRSEGRYMVDIIGLEIESERVPRVRRMRSNDRET